ncbi:hypothetical protein ACWKWP_15590 [Agromyces soli]
MPTRIVASSSKSARPFRTGPDPPALALSTIAEPEWQEASVVDGLAFS